MLYMSMYGCICVWVYMCMGTNPDMHVIKNYGNPILKTELPQLFEKVVINAQLVNYLLIDLDYN